MVSLSYRGKLPESSKSNFKREVLNPVKCKKCNLVQLELNFNPNYLHNEDYGYRSGIKKELNFIFSFLNLKIV